MNNTPPIDFATLTLRDALDLAILIEEDARERYGEFVEQLRRHQTDTAARFFASMVVNETKHRDALAARRRELFGSEPTRVNPAMLCEVEAPAYQDAAIFMSVREALDVAMNAERRAYRFFDDALAHVKDPDVRVLFTELRDEEAEHQQLVQRHIDALPPGSATPPSHESADEPVGH
jgi:rubrerythrin